MKALSLTIQKLWPMFKVFLRKKKKKKKRKDPDTYKTKCDLISEPGLWQKLIFCTQTHGWTDRQADSSIPRKQ